MNYFNSFGFGAYSLFGLTGLFFAVIMFWSLYWKGRALWLAARKGSLYWFVALMLINTAGLLEIAYIYYFSKKDGCCEGGKCESKKDGECCGGGKCDDKKDESCDCGHEHK